MSVSKTKNRIVIDREKCTGCGYCIDACHMGALALVDGKACLVDENHCDGLGVCIGECPSGAISIEEVSDVSSPPFSSVAVDGHDVIEVETLFPDHCANHVSGVSFMSHAENIATEATPPQKSPAKEPEVAKHFCPKSQEEIEQTKEEAKGFTCGRTVGCTCPNFMSPAYCHQGTPTDQIEKEDIFYIKYPSEDNVDLLPPLRSKSELETWPIQLHLIRPTAPQFQKADLLIAASCSAFSHAFFHEELLRGKVLIIACAKLDNTEGYLEKLIELFRDTLPSSVTIARMEVPCCQTLTKLVLRARKAAESSIPVKEIVVGLQGGLGDEIVHL